MTSSKTLLQALAAALITCVICSGLVLSDSRIADACSPGFRIDFEHFLEAETLDDLHRPDGPYAEQWAAYWEDSRREEPLPEVTRITAVTLVHTVAEVRGTVADSQPLEVFTGATTIVHAWGPVDVSPNPRAEPVRPPDSCGTKALPDHGTDVWYLNGSRDSTFLQHRMTLVATADLIPALTRLFGEPVSPERDLAEEAAIITDVTAQLETLGELLVMPIEPARWLNPVTGQAEDWDGSQLAQLDALGSVEAPTPTFTG